jgi:hypothetical protein
MTIRQRRRHHGIMVKEQPGPSSRSQAESRYEIQIRGALDERWLAWFNGMDISIEHTAGCLPFTTILCPVMDQARLRGTLNRIWDLNLSLISVQQRPDPALEAASPDGR